MLDALMNVVGFVEALALVWLMNDAVFSPWMHLAIILVLVYEGLAAVHKQWKDRKELEVPKETDNAD